MNERAGRLPVQDEPAEYAGPNEPPGFRQIAVHSGATLEPAGWTYWQNPNCNNRGYAIAEGGRIVGHFPRGMGDPCGQRPFTLSHDLEGISQVYFRFRLRISNNWLGHPSLANKIGFLRSADTPGNASPAVVSLRGSGLSPLELSIERQNRVFSGDAQDRRLANVGNATVRRGAWYDIEVLLSWDRVEAWVDGRKTHDHSGAFFHTGPFGWDNWSWDPVWGGRVVVLDRDQTMEVEFFYLSGPRSQSEQVGRGGG